MTRDAAPRWRLTIVETKMRKYSVNYIPRGGQKHITVIVVAETAAQAMAAVQSKLGVLAFGASIVDASL